MDHVNETQYLEIVPFTKLFNGTTSEPPLFSQYSSELLTFGASCCVIFAIVGVLGNFVSILALAKFVRLRNATTAFIINLCIADLVFCSVSLPLSAVTFLERAWNYGDGLCKFFPVIRYSNGALSIFSVIAITINRYILIVHPAKYSALFKPRNVAIMIGILWFLSFLIIFPTLLEVWGKFGFDPRVGTCSILKLNGKSPKTLIYVLAFGLPSLVFVICYSRIYFVVRKTSRNVHSHESSGVPQKNSRHGWFRIFKVRKLAPMDKKELAVLKIMLVIFITFILCYFPVSFVKVFKKEDNMPVLNILGYLFVYFSNCINPIIYVAMSKEYRQAYIQLFTG